MILKSMSGHGHVEKLSGYAQVSLDVDAIFVIETPEDVDTVHNDPTSLLLGHLCACCDLQSRFGGSYAILLRENHYDGSK